MGQDEITDEGEGAMPNPKCIACRLDIEDGASKCPKCHSYQTPWRNRLPIIGTIAGILAVAGSAAAVVLATATNFWQELFGEDAVEVVLYEDGRPIVLNTGSGPVLVETVTERADALNYSSVSPVQVVVEKGSVHVSRAATGGRSGEVRGHPVENVSDEHWEAMKRGKVPGIAPYVYSKGHQSLETFRRHVPGLRTFEVTCTVQFRPVKGGAKPMVQEFPCVGIMMISS